MAMMNGGCFTSTDHEKWMRFFEYLTKNFLFPVESFQLTWYGHLSTTFADFSGVAIPLHKPSFYSIKQKDKLKERQRAVVKTTLLFPLVVLHAFRQCS